MKTLWPIAALLLFACGSEPEPAPPSEPAPAPAPAPEPIPAPKPEPAAVPAAADPKKGAELYAIYCASCHGPGGKGDGPAAVALDPKPADHTNAAYMNALSDEHLFKVIKEGGTAVGKSPMMAPWGGTLSDAQIRDLVAHVRSLAGA